MILSAKHFLLALWAVQVRALAESEEGSVRVLVEEKIELLEALEAHPVNTEEMHERELQSGAGTDFDDPYNYFNQFTTEEDWTRCKVEHEEKCPPTVSKIFTK